MSRDAELEALRAGVSCAVVLERHPPPWQLDKRQSSRNCLKYRRGEGEIILVTHQGRGWWDPGSTAKGDVFSLVQHLDPSLNLGEVRQLLRPLAGVHPSFPEHLRRASKQSKIPFATRWEKGQRLAPGSPAWRYLTEERRLPPSVVRAAIAADLLREGPRGSAWFAHRDQAGRLTGIEMRGPEYRGFSPGGTKTLFRFSADGVVATRLVVLEAPIDALSLAALEGMPAGTAYAATAGGMGPETITELDLQLRTIAATTGAVLVGAADADRAGDGYADRLQAMATKAEVRFERLRPPDGLDWNDVLRGRGA